MRALSVLGRAWQLRLLVGAALVTAGWWASWHAGQVGGAAGFSFFVLWLGYILAVDGLVELRTGSSPLTRNVSHWLFMFVASVPVWWLFEVLNRFLQNWEYLGTWRWGPLERLLLSSLSFSTVIPAVFTTAELVASFGTPGWLTRLGRLPVTPRALATIAAVGLALLCGILVAPRIFYPATWLCVLFIIDPLNHALGAPSVIGRLGRGDGRLVWWLALAALCCGLFWELWNFRADPKWVYHIPFFGQGEMAAMPYVFEMPLPGYLGYLPFGVELYAAYHFLVVVANRTGADALPHLGRGGDA